MGQTKFSISSLICGIYVQILLFNEAAPESSVVHAVHVDGYTIHLDSNKISGDFRQFWRSTGFWLVLNYLLLCVIQLLLVFGAMCSSLVRAISRSSLCSTTGVLKAVVCAILSVGWCI